MRRPNKISMGLVGASLIIIVLVWPHYVKQMRMEDAAEYIESQMFRSNLAMKYPFRPCLGDIGFDYNLRIKGEILRSSEDIAERKRCVSNRDKYIEDNKLRLETLKTRDGCSSALEAEYGDEFTIEENYKVCAIAIKNYNSKPKI